MKHEQFVSSKGKFKKEIDNNNLNNLDNNLQLVKRQSCHHIETSQLICSANQLTGFYMIAILAFNELNPTNLLKVFWSTENFIKTICKLLIFPKKLKHNFPSLAPTL